MRYDLTDHEQCEQLLSTVREAVSSAEGVAEFNITKPFRHSNRQNRYLHLIIRYFATVYGTTAENAKEQFFKHAANREIFYDGVTGNSRSTASLSDDEMHTAIERFRNWSSMVAGIYLPASDETENIRSAQSEINRNRNYL